MKYFLQFAKLTITRANKKKGNHSKTISRKLQKGSLLLLTYEEETPDFFSYYDTTMSEGKEISLFLKHIGGCKHLNRVQRGG